MAVPSRGAPGLPESPRGALAAEMALRMDRLPARLAHQRVFLSIYQRTTQAVGDAVERACFEDPEWVEGWEATFASHYLAALDAELSGGDTVPRPWRLVFAASLDLPPLRHVLLGMNAHINYDLPQALLAVINDDDFSNPLLIDRRRRDSERIDTVLATRMPAEQDELIATDATTMLDRLLTPLGRLGSRSLLHEARQKVWHNTLELHRSRVAGTAEYAVRLAELEMLSAAKITDLLGPGYVVLRLAVSGFGVSLPPQDR